MTLLFRPISDLPKVFKCWRKGHDWTPWRESFLPPHEVRSCARCGKPEVRPELPIEFVIACIQSIEEKP